MTFIDFICYCYGFIILISWLCPQLSLSSLRMNFPNIDYHIFTYWKVWITFCNVMKFIGPKVENASTSYFLSLLDKSLLKVTFSQQIEPTRYWIDLLNRNGATYFVMNIKNSIYKIIVHCKRTIRSAHLKSEGNSSFVITCCLYCLSSIDRWYHCCCYGTLYLNTKFFEREYYETDSTWIHRYPHI